MATVISSGLRLDRDGTPKFWCQRRTAVNRVFHPSAAEIPHWYANGFAGTRDHPDHENYLRFPDVRRMAFFCVPWELAALKRLADFHLCKDRTGRRVLHARANKKQTQSKECNHTRKG